MFNKRENYTESILDYSNDVESGELTNSNSNTGFKSTEWLQFDPVFQTFVQIGIYICVLGVIIDYTFARNVDKAKYEIPDLLMCRLTKVLYTIDVFFLLDVILMILYRRSENMDIVENIYLSRHPLILLVEIISIIPLEFVYYHMSEKEMTMFAALRIRYVLRSARFSSIFKSKSITKSSIAEQLLLHILIIFALSSTFCAYYYEQMCYIDSCDYAEWPRVYLILSKLLNALMHLNVDVNFLREDVYGEGYIFLIWMGYFYSAYLQCYFTCISLENIGGQLDYVVRMKRDMELLNIKSLNDRLGKKIFKNFYNIQWKKGMITDIYKNRSYLPEMVIRELTLDSRWNGLKHTHLFRKQSVHFVRHISAYIKIKYLHGGEVIYRRGHTKLYMIYLMRGNINMLCDNGETPMISFGRGTVFGETSLYVPTIASNTIVCEGFCQVWFLYRKDFINIRFKYPGVYKSLQNDICKRFAKAQLYNDVVHQHHERIGITDMKASLSIKYVKNTLSTLLGTVDMKAQLKQTWSLSHKRFDQLRQRTAFCAKYLDLYVLTPDIEITSELNLEMELTSTMHPESMLILIGEIMIVALCIIYYIIILTYVTFPLDQHAHFFYVLIYFLTFIWCFDVFMQWSVHVITVDVIYTKRIDIFLECLTKTTFYIDILAALPVELIFLLLDGDLEPQVQKVFYLNRLLKMYRVFRYFRVVENDTILIVNLKQNLKYFSYFLMMIYGNICIHRYCLDSALDKEINTEYFILETCRTLSLITGISAKKTQLNMNISWLAIIFQLIVFIFYNYVFSMIAAGTSMYIKSYRRFHEMMFHSAWSTKLLDKHIELRVRRHFHLHAIYRQGLYLLDQKMCLSAMTDEMKAFAKEIIYSNSLKEAAFLKNLPSKLFVELFPICSLVIMPPGEILYYANEAATEIYIIKRGYCKSIESRYLKHYKSGDSLNVVPCFMETTSVDTVKTITAVTCIALSYDKLKNVMSRFDPSLIKQMKECVRKGRPLDSVRMEAVSNESQTVETVHNIMVNKQNKYYFKAFPSNVRFLKSFLLHVTFAPQGSFAYYWEIGRTTVTMLSILLTTIPTVFSYRFSAELVILALCDIFSIIDLYIQHHICYFNRFSLLVYHPYLTAKHYWYHGFCLDLVGILPFDWIYVFTTKQHASILTAVVIRINRYLQVIRVYKFTNYLIYKYAYYVRYILLMRWIIIAICIIQISSSFIILGICNFQWKDHGYYNMTCPKYTLLRQVYHPNANKHNPHFISFVGFQLILLVFCNRNFHKETPILLSRILLMQIIAILGLIVYISMLVTFIAHGLFSHSGLITYQTRMKILVNFMSGRVGKAVQKEIIDYYEYVWKKTDGNNLKEDMQIFNASLRMDSLYNVYGKALKCSGIFPQASKPFIKSFMMHISHEFYRNRGIICMVNNIHGRIYIVFKGTVDVLGPDYNRLLTLGPGSIFGNLDNVPLIRQTLTIVANGHVEVLSISSVTFYDVLSKYPTYLKQFKRHTMVHVDYIETMEIDESEMVHSTSTLSKQSKQDHVHNYFTRIRRRNAFIRIWDLIIINILYVLSVNFESFNIITTTHNIFIISFSYIFDLMAVYNMYQKFHTVIKDEFGFIVSNRMKISEQYRKSFFGFYLELIATLPIEVITLSFMNHQYFYLIFHLMRCNRLLRFPLVFKATLQAQQKLNVNVYAIRILSSLLWLNIIFCISSILMALIVIPTHHTHCDHSSIRTEWHFFIKTTLDTIKMNNGGRLDFSLLFDIEWLTLLATAILILLQRFVVDVIFLSQTCATLQMIRNNHTKYKKYVAWMVKFMELEYVSLPLHKRILRYAKLLWLYQNGVQFPSLLNEAPYYIREAVLNSIFGFHLREHYIFRDCHVDFLRQVAASIKCTYHFQGDVICFVGDIDECMYIIHDGRVAALDKDSLDRENVHAVLTSGEIFGIKQALIARTGHDYTYKALEYTVILTLQRSQFVHLITFFPASRYIIYKALEESND